MNKTKAEPTEAQQLRTALEECTAQLEATNQELERFNYSVSHDLRAPLRAIEGFSKILLEDYHDKLDEDGKRFLKIIDSSSRKMTSLLDDLLRLSRLGRQPMNPERIKMNEVIESAWADVRPLSGKQIDLKIDPLPDAWGDRALLEQIWTELLENAVKFTAPREKPIIEIKGAIEPDRNVYSIKDNGVGFNMKSAGKLFNVFQRMHTEQEFEGNGIGLAIVQRLIRRHSGQAWTESEVNQGATFYFALPAAKIN